MEELLTCLKNHNQEFEKIEKENAGPKDIIEVMNNMTCFYLNAYKSGKEGSAIMYNSFYQMAREKLIKICPEEKTNYIESLEALI
jgi:hypothetical protein